MHFLDTIDFIASWMLFIYPIYQGVIEFMNRNSVIDFYKSRSPKYHQVPVWYWICPPLKMYLEKKRLEQLIIDSHITEKDAEDLYFVSNKATAWFYISLAGLLQGINATHSLLVAFHIHLPLYLFIILIGVIIVLSFLIIIYRLSDSRKAKFFKKYGVTK